MDARAIRLNGCYACSVVTSVTAQNTTHVGDMLPIPSSLVISQLEAIADDFCIDAIKIGLVPSVDCAEAVGHFLTERNIECPVIVDPVERSTSDVELAPRGALDALLESLGPRLTAITPNVAEAHMLSGQSISILNDALTAGERIRGRGCHNVIVTGGHLQGNEGTDLWVFEGGFEILEPQQRFSSTVRGTGCMFASVIASQLAHGVSMREAILKAKAFVENALAHDEELGSGTALTTIGIATDEE